jgi:hypothetical protein
LFWKKQKGGAMNAAQIHLLCQLSIVGQLRVKEQLYTTRKQIYTAKPAWYSWAVRGWFGETREANLSALGDILQHADHVVDMELAKRPRNAMFLTQLADALDSAHAGIARMITTYTGDTVTTSKLSIHQINIQNSVSKIRQTEESQSHTNPASPPQATPRPTSPPPLPLRRDLATPPGLHNDTAGVGVDLGGSEWHAQAPPFASRQRTNSDPEEETV